MPVQRCNIDGNPGWKWGEAGKCYSYTPGNATSEKEAKRKAYIQGYAMGELTEMEQQDWIPADIELANILNVPVLTSGEFMSHNAGPVIITEEDLDEIIEGSNELQEIIIKAIETGEYEGNKDLTKRLSKPIPGLINLKHQSILPETLKKATKNITTSFKKALINDKPWIIQQIQNVPSDIADTIRREFPYRSVELLPLKNPKTGKQYTNIIRSTAFLDQYTPPAVGGQSPELIVEFQGTKDEPLTIITTTGVTIMPDKKEEIKVDVSELQSLRDTLTELQAKVSEQDKAIELATQRMEEKDSKIAELQQQQDKMSAETLVTHLARVREENGRVLRVSPAFLDIVRPRIELNGVIELQDGQHSQREAFTAMCDEIVELSLKEGITIDITPNKPGNHQPPNAKQSDSEKVAELMEKEGLSKNEAFIRMLNANLVKKEV